MTDKYKDLRDALAAGPTVGPWFVSDSLGFAVAAVAKKRVCADEPPKVSPAVDATYIAAANPEAIRALLAERDGLLAQHHTDSKTLREYAQQRDDFARAAIEAQVERDAAREERDRLRAALTAAVDCGMVPKSSVADGGASAHARQVVVADMIRAALAQHQGEKHDDQ